MNIFGLEINFHRKDDSVDNTIWFDQQVHTAQRIGDMTPTQLRAALAKVHKHTVNGGTLRVSANDKFKRILFVPGGKPTQLPLDPAKARRAIERDLLEGEEYPPHK